jgi:hypothetical protein
MSPHTEADYRESKPGDRRVRGMLTISGSCLKGISGLVIPVFIEQYLMRFAERSKGCKVVEIGFFTELLDVTSCLIPSSYRWEMRAMARRGLCPYHFQNNYGCVIEDNSAVWDGSRLSY